MTKEDILQAVGRGWCHPNTEDRTMDADLASAIADEVWKADTTPNLGCATTKQLLDELMARAEVDGTMDYRMVDSH